MKCMPPRSQQCRENVSGDVADTAPTDSVLTPYDYEHLITYLRLLDADADGADCREVARIVLHRDPEREFIGARRSFESHLSRAKWMDGARIQAAPSRQRRIVERRRRSV